ncbi:MAG: hypothetical protein AAF518_21315 [Spirochaetota bacterium]
MFLDIFIFLLQLIAYSAVTAVTLLFVSQFFSKKKVDEKPEEKAQPRESKKVLEEVSGTVGNDVHIKKHNNYIPRGDTMLNSFMHKLGDGFTLRSNRVWNTHEKKSVYKKKNSYD